ncbi:hypothetical protein NPIL_368981 [Nephila pilipes]|uniref:Uncharacterized protein n=1 Tax=Nephila pilipes TaxID=299642 RepID=A0A8X6N1G8_NEPPI|nr:hypothetical protein NPIL_368981 [Nephila pilipes]
MATKEQFPESGIQECPITRRTPTTHAPQAANNSVCRHLLRGDSGSVRWGESALNTHTGGLLNKQNKIALEHTLCPVPSRSLAAQVWTKE